jgi:hypothetical protein
MSNMLRLEGVRRNPAHNGRGRSNERFGGKGIAAEQNIGSRIRHLLIVFNRAGLYSCKKQVSCACRMLFPFKLSVVEKKAI